MAEVVPVEQGMETETETIDAITARLEELTISRPPPGRQPILPRVYEYYNDDEDVEEYDYMDEEGNVRRRDAGDNEDSDEDVLQYLYSKKTRKQRIADAEAKYEEFRMRESEDRIREAEIQRLEDLKFPTKMGFYYTDGYYDKDPPFGIHEHLLEDFVSKEAIFRAKLAKRRGETFTSMFKRYFWPPSKYLCWGRCFRTRGSYLDFDEIDPSQLIPIEVDLEHPGVEMLSRNHAMFQTTDIDIFAEGQEGVVVVDEDGEDEDEEEEALLEATKLKKKRRVKGAVIMGASGPITVLETKHTVGWEDFYYDDEKGEFQLKIPGLDIDYYFDAQNTCWRRKRGKKKPDDQMTPYDFYYDDDAFYPRDSYQGKHLLDIAFDSGAGVWKFEPKESTLLLIKRGEFVRQTKPIPTVKPDPAPTSISDVDAMDSSAPKRRKSKVKPPEVGPVSFYFDESDTFWKKKTEEVAKAIEYDENGRRWIKRFECGDWRGLTGYSPDDFFWSDALGKFQLKTKRQPELYQYNYQDGVWHTVKLTKNPNRTNSSPTDYFFEDGMYKLKEPLRDNLYKKMRYALFYKRKEQPISGLYPEDFYYDYDKKLWLPRLVRMALLKVKGEDLPWSRQDAIMKKETILLTQDDFWFDVEEGVFLKKDPGLAALDTYYFDQKDQVWKSVAQVAVSRLRLLPGDFYFNGKDFKRKSKDDFESSYEFDPKTGIYWGKDVKNRNANKLVSKHYFDYEQETWRIRKDDTVDVRKDAAGRFVKRDSIKDSPDDYYWDNSQGRFLKKDFEHEENYEMGQADGVFKLISSNQASNSNDFTPRSFYFDEQDNRWRLKVTGQERDYVWDKNNHFFRHVISTDTKSGLKATDYYFNQFLGTYMVVANYDRTRGIAPTENLLWNSERKYSKPWLKKAPQRYGETPGSRNKPKLSSDSDKTVTNRVGFMPDLSKEEPAPQITKLKLRNFDVENTTQEDLKQFFPKAFKIELKPAEGIAVISFTNADDANNARGAKDGVSFKGKIIILETIMLE